MSPDLEQALVQLVQQISSAGDFVVETAPAVIQEFILWAKITSIIGGFWLLVGTPAVGYVAWRFFQQSIIIARERGERYDSNEEVYLFIVASALTAAGFVGVVAAMSAVCDNLAAWFAPQWFVVSQFIR